MKILYAIQGTGNGHVSRAREIIPYLKKYGDLDLLISGTQAEVQFDDPIKFQLKGFGFVFGKNGGIDFKKTWKESDFFQFMKEVRKLPIEDYDLIINDFEPVTAWACKLKKKKSIAMSHQSAYISEKTPQLKGFHWGKLIMNHYAPATHAIAFHFEKYDDFIHTPIIRSEIRELPTKNLGYYTVYLPAYSDEFILDKVKKIPNSRWEIFSKHSDRNYQKYNAEIFPIDNKKFQQSLANATGLLTGGGFEGPAEALFLGKKVLCVPMHNQYEQQCNALSIEELGISVIWNKNEFDAKLSAWVENPATVKVFFPDETDEIIRKMMARFKGNN